MARTVKDPGERRSELLACAMRLFDEEGYDNVSVRAVARAAGVAPALAYHYFDSKEKLFDEAVRAYARRCADGFIALLEDRSLTLDEAVDRAVELAGTHDFPHAGAFHGGGAGALHDRLSLALCEEVRRRPADPEQPAQHGRRRCRRARGHDGLRLHRPRLGSGHAGCGGHVRRPALPRRAHRCIPLPASRLGIPPRRPRRGFIRPKVLNNV